MRFNFARAFSFALVMGILPLAATAQDVPRSFAFEVVSVKPSPPVPASGGVYFGPPQGGPGTPNPGMITWTYATLSAIFLRAYEINRFQLRGPEWFTTERFDIVAKVPADATKEQVNVMWRELLADRFGVVLHHESKEFEVEELVVDKGGAKVKETDWDLAAPLPSGPPQVDNKGGVRSPGQVVTVFPTERGMHLKVVGMSQPISQLTGTFGNALNRPVLDKTGLTGRYDYTVEFVLDGAGIATGPTTAEAPAPDLNTAVQQQLGLRLVSAKAMLEVLVIDKAEKVPTAN